MDVRLLGPFEVIADGEVLSLGGLRQRAVLAVLALHPNEVLAADRLADLVWGGQPPDGVRTTLQGYVFHLRKALADTPARIETRRPGYLLDISPELIDARRFERLVEAGRAAYAAENPAVAAARLREALDLWRGPALSDFTGESFAESEIPRLEELRLAALEERVEADLALSRHAEIVAELETLVREQPLREALRGQLMRALHGSGRTAEALRVYRDGRTVLAEELGIDPGLELQRLERAILLQDPSVERDAPAARRTVGNLPAPVTSFIGRERELGEVAAALSRSRLVTLTGAGGSGKTRLALQAGADAVARFVDGVWLVELAGLSDPQLLVQQFAAGAGVVDDGERPLAEALVDALRRRDCLLVVDNCEHMLVPVAAEIDRLLRACPHLRVLTTSREALGLSGELAWAVPTLPVPPAGKSLSVRDALEFGAIRLFGERAAAAAPGFELGPTNLTAAIEVCRRLDGMPLALELAAARMRVLSLGEIATRLDDRFRLLTGGSRDAIAHQRTLRATIDWSYETLGAAEQVLFARLSVFAGPFSFERAEAVGAGGVVGDDLLDVLDGLVAKSLVTRVDRAGAARFRLLETLRHYGMERLAEMGETEMVRRRHADVLTTSVEGTSARLPGPDQAGKLDRLDEEQDDHRAALEWLLETGDGRAAQRLAAALWPYWDHRNDKTEPHRWMARALAADRNPTCERLSALVASAYLGLLDEDLSAAVASCEEGLALATELGDSRSQGRLLVRRAEIARIHEADPKRADELCRQAVELLDADGDQWGAAQARWRQTLLASDRGDLDAASACAMECLAIWDATGDLEHAAGARALLAGLARDRGDLEHAAQLYEQSLTSFRRAHEPHGAAQMILMLASLAADRDDVDVAEKLGRESLELHEELSDARGVARSLLVLGEAAATASDLERANALCELALARLRARNLPADVPLALTSLARIALERGDLARTEAWCDESLVSYRAGGARRHAAPALVVQARARARAGQAGPAAALADEALALYRAAGDERGVSRSLEAAAEAAVAGGEFERAARYLSAARTTRATAGHALARIDLDSHERTVDAVRRAVAGTEFGRAWLDEWNELTIDLTQGTPKVEQGELPGQRS